MQAIGVPERFLLLAESIRQPGEAAHLHADGKVLTLHNRSADAHRIGVPENWDHLRIDHLGRRIPRFAIANAGQYPQSPITTDPADETTPSARVQMGRRAGSARTQNASTQPTVRDFLVTCKVRAGGFHRARTVFSPPKHRVFAVILRCFHGETTVFSR